METFPSIVVCADVGSVARGNFGWWASSGESGDRPSTFAAFVAAALAAGESVAAGFECPLFVPLGNDETRLTSARPGEGSRPWSAGAGCGALATGLVQVAWVLAEIRTTLETAVPVFQEWGEFAERGSGLLVWEAFVSGGSKGGSHIADARLGAEAFMASLPDPTIHSSVSCADGVYSLVGAALLRSGWSVDIAVLQQECLVLKAGENAP